MIGFNMKFDPGNIMKKLDNAHEEGQKALDTQVLKDSNNYIPADQWDLRDSGVRNTQPGEGKVTWNTPYARRLYYNPQYNFSKDKNPQAQGLWFEAAKSGHVKDWVKILEESVKRQL